MPPAERPGARFPRSALDQDSTIIAVVEMSQSSWLVGGVLPGIGAVNPRQESWSRVPKGPAWPAVNRWRDEAVRAGPQNQSRGLHWPSKLVATASGWRVGLSAGGVEGAT